MRASRLFFIDAVRWKRRWFPAERGFSKEGERFIACTGNPRKMPKRVVNNHGRDAMISLFPCLLLFFAEFEAHEALMYTKNIYVLHKLYIHNIFKFHIFHIFHKFFAEFEAHKALMYEKYLYILKFYIYTNSIYYLEIINIYK